MPIKRVTPAGAIKRAIDRRVDNIVRAIVNNLVFVGEKLIEHARDSHRKRYTDRTGNLTSSIGYVVLVNGKAVSQSDFQEVKGPEKGAGKGSKIGKNFLKKLIADNSEGIVFIAVAGMPYAAYVERKNLDVLDSAEMMAADMIPRMMEKLKF